MSEYGKGYEPPQKPKKEKKPLTKKWWFWVVVGLVGISIITPKKSEEPASVETLTPQETVEVTITPMPTLKPTATPTPTVTLTPEPPSILDPFTFEGNGDGSTDSFLSSTRIVWFRHSGKKGIQITLVNVTTGEKEIVGESDGNYDSTKNIRFITGNEYRWDVAADGKWGITTEDVWGLETAVTPSPANNQETKSRIVYKGETGTKYHLQSCHTLKNGAFPITLEEALAEGREPCKVCGP